jgi:hypothetical protein
VGSNGMSKQQDELKESGDAAERKYAPALTWAEDSSGCLLTTIEEDSPEFAERVSAALREKDIWMPVSPALAKRIDAAISSWGSSEERHFVRETTRRAKQKQADGFEKLNDKDYWGTLSVM